MNEADIKRDYENRSLAVFLHDVKRGGVKDVTDEYFIMALGWPLIRRYDLAAWLTRFAERHRLIFDRDKSRGRSHFIRATF